MNGKGQIGALILFGLIILIGFSFVIYLKNNNVGADCIEQSTFWFCEKRVSISWSGFFSITADITLIILIFLYFDVNTLVSYILLLKTILFILNFFQLSCLPKDNGYKSLQLCQSYVFKNFFYISIFIKHVTETTVVLGHY